MKAYLIILLLIGIYSCSEQTSEDKSRESKQELIKTDSDVKDSLVTFFIYGELAPTGYLDDENSITEKYGFKLKRIAGSDVDETIIKETHTQNQKALMKMNEEYGNDWMLKFEDKTKYKLAIPFN